ncbi:MAG TPA: LysM peptidoglycan-binding domain-containing protein, partial [Alkalispirochaeta sp.]|nr:LysM peptidoglycan-binding domain-containing protein [Alkalispirochaeta sp.]
RSGGGSPSGASGSAARRWRGPAFVVIGVVLIAGAVTLLLWRDESGERFLARLGSQSETALMADGENTADGGDSDADGDTDTGANAGAETDAETSDADAADGGDVDTADDADAADSATSDRPDPVEGADTTDAAADTITTTETSDSDAFVEDAPITVTVTDILRMVNRIAELNEYAPIGSLAPDARDPDWIFPGNQLELPDQALYEIRRGDTMWAIADRFIRQSAQEHNQMLVDLSERIQQGERPTEELQILLEESYVESTRRRAGELLTEIGVE